MDGCLKDTAFLVNLPGQITLPQNSSLRNSSLRVGRNQFKFPNAFPICSFTLPTTASSYFLSPNWYLNCLLNNLFPHFLEFSGLARTKACKHGWGKNYIWIFINL